MYLQPVYGRDAHSRAKSPPESYDMTGYDAYDAKDAFGLQAMRGEGSERRWDRGDIDAKTTVLGIRHDDDAVAYPLPEVRAAGGLISTASNWTRAHRTDCHRYLIPCSVAQFEASSNE